MHIISMIGIIIQENCLATGGYVSTVLADLLLFIWVIDSLCSTRHCKEIYRDSGFEVFCNKVDSF